MSREKDCRSKVLDALNSRYSCLYDPQSDASTSSERPELFNNARRCLSPLWVYGNQEVDEIPNSFSKLLDDQNIIDSQIIKDKVTAALPGLRFREPHVLVQFWSPVTLRKRCLLTTLDQPFGLGAADEGLYLYRLESEQRMFVVDGEQREDIGPPGRVYRQKLPEWSFDKNMLLTRQNVKDWAASYDIHGYICLPVFEPDNGCCVGVLELITSSDYVDYAFEVREVWRALKEQKLKSPNVLEDLIFYAGDERKQREFDEILCALKTICDVQDIPLAQTWGLSGYNSVVANSGNLERTCSSYNRKCIGKVCMSTYGLPYYARNLRMWRFVEACTQQHLDKSKGIVGRSLWSRGSCYCEDVTKLDEDGYPLGYYARVNGITSCLAVYLESIQRDVEYVIEFVLPPYTANGADLHSLVKTVKHVIEKASSVKLGIMSSLQVIGREPFNWNLESPPSPITLLDEKGEVPPDPGNQQSLVDNELTEVTISNDQSVVGVNVEHIEHDYLENEPSVFAAAAGTSQSVVPCLEVEFEDSDINKGKTRTNCQNSSNKRGRKRKGTDGSISLEDISKHYGKTMDEAAAILHDSGFHFEHCKLSVSRSTLKRICRSLGVFRWPYKNGPDKSDSLIEATNAIHASQGVLTSVFEGSSEPLSTTNVTQNAATLTEHGKYSSTPVLHQQVQTIRPDEPAQLETTFLKSVEHLTIKATYKKNTVSFSFILSDGFAKLEELISSKFQLKLGSFSLKYEDNDGDMILIACDCDLMESVNDFKLPNDQTVVRLLVWPVVDKSPDA
ncbi:NLP3-like protein [Tanacetum coccineum]